MFALRAEDGGGIGVEQRAGIGEHAFQADVDPFCTQGALLVLSA